MTLALQMQKHGVTHTEAVSLHSNTDIWLQSQAFYCLGLYKAVFTYYLL